MSVRLKLFWASLALIVCVGLLSGVYLERRLRGWFEESLQHDLAVRVEMVRDRVEVEPALVSLIEGDALADQLGRSSGTRVTIIDHQGTVLGDSHVPFGQLGGVEEHSQRPEVLQALDEGRGWAHRYSNTVHMDMLYVARPFRHPDGTDGVVRVAMPLRDVESAVGQLRLVLAVAGLVGLVLAVLISGLASHWAARSLSGIVRSARHATERMGLRSDPTAGDELGNLAGSFNELVAELEQTLATLAAERERLETILQGMTEAVVALDAENLVTHINQAAMDLLDVSSEARGQPVIEVARVAGLADLLDRVHATPNVPQESEVTLPRARQVLARAARVKGTGGTVLVMLDITEMRRLEKVRQDFVANVSHELRTPVSVIQANAETLIDGALRDEKHAPRFLDAISRSAQRLARLVADLLDLSRIESGHFAIDLCPVGVARSVQRALDGIQGLAARKQITIVSVVDPEAYVLADANALDQVLTNLLDNAVKYTPAGGQVEVRVQSEAGGAQSSAAWCIEVSDDGPGIEPRHRARVFERFYRVDPGRSREMGGTGLGLSIVKHLVGAMNGQVSVRGAPSGGSLFRVLLPAAEPVAEPVSSTPEPVDVLSPASS